MTETIIKNTISVLIPTCNGEATLRELFASLKRQTIQPTEILVVDSASTDGTVAICTENGATVLTITRADFDHGGTRTLLAQRAIGEIVVYFTQDAILATPESLYSLVEPLLHNTLCGCSYGRQLSTPSASWHAAHLRDFNYPPESSLRSFDDRKKYGLRTVFTSNSFAAYKRDNLASVGWFKNDLIFGEDTCTVGKILKDGFQSGYIGKATVYHSHNYSLEEEFCRSFDIGVLHSSEKWLLNTFGKAEGVGLVFVKSAIAQLKKEQRYLLMFDFFLRTGCKFLGYKLGRMHDKIPKSLLPKLSMNSNWWLKDK